jgi:hypothetical protein
MTAIPIGFVADAFLPQSGSYGSFSPYVTNMTALHPSIGLWDMTVAELAAAGTPIQDVIISAQPGSTGAAPDGGVTWGFDSPSNGRYLLRCFVGGVLADIGMNFSVRYRR